VHNSILIQYYLSSYLTQVNRYKYEYRGSVVTYYQLDQENSIYDKDTLFGGSYERVGKLSGLKFKKILNFYVAGSQQVTLTLNSQDMGSLIDYRTNVMFPDIIKPTMYDFLQFTVAGTPVGPLFQVVNFSLAFMQETVRIYNCDIIGVGIPVTEIEKQVSSVWGYTDIDHKIHPAEEFRNILLAYENVKKLEPGILRDNITDIIKLES